MHIGILGSGDVGRTLGAGLARHGHEVMLGTRDPSAKRIREWVKETGHSVRAGTFAEAAQFARLAILATAWSGTGHALELAGKGHLKDNVVLDVTNPLVFGDGAPTLALGCTDSGGEQVQRWLPDAHVVKALNIVGHAHMVHPDFPGGPPDMFLCGNDPEAKAQVAGLLETLGWPVVDLGGIEMSRYLEPMAMVWITHAIRTGGGNHAFKLLRKS